MESKKKMELIDPENRWEVARGGEWWAGQVSLCG